MGVEFRLLDGVEVRIDGVRVDPGHARQRCVLVALLVDPGRVVLTDRLLDRVWDDRPPLRARSVLRTYLSRLRRVLAGTGATIIRRDGGYALTVPPDSVDLHRFRDLVRQARSLDDQAALGVLERALALWRTEPLSGVDTPWADAVRRTLEAEHAEADRRRVDLALAQGRHAELLAELPVRAAAHPLDEHVAAQLMRALHGAGRPADALRHYQVVRTSLIDHLGAEPGPELRALHRSLLTDTAVEERRAPHRLPVAPPFLIGRDAELARLDALLAPGRPAIAVLSGGGGVGKTWLALHWAHRARFPDGRLHVDLRGFDPVAAPLPPDAAVRVFLDALGVAPRSVPVEPAAQIALYHELTVGRRLLVVLDNARDTAQVTPLLPVGGTSAVLVTSRNRLTGLIATHGAAVVGVPVLDETRSAELFAAHVGTRGDPALVRHCAGLPLALGILAARTKAQPDVPAAVLAAEVAEARLDALDTGDLSTSLRAVFAASVRALTPTSARMFALLGVVPGPDVPVSGAAALADVPRAAAQRALRELEDAHLVHQAAPGRYRMHDLVRLYAGESTTEGALTRLADHYCHVASRAADRFTPGEPHRRPPVPPPAGPSPDFTSIKDAIEWMIAERACVLALARHAEVRHAVHLSRALHRFLDVAAYLHDALDLHRTAAERSTGTDGYVLCHLGGALARIGAPADGHLTRALDAAGDDLALVNVAATNLGISAFTRGDLDEALRHHERALDAARRAGFRHSEAISLVNLGEVHSERGRPDLARALLDRCCELASELSDSGLLGMGHNALGTTYRKLGDRDRAHEHHLKALRLVGGGVLRALELGVRNDYAASVHALDGPEAALPHYRTALELAERIGLTEEESRARAALTRAQSELSR
ncbi:BTAD domain-containing putative transcriptional regulator [Saccharothrix violaceirubra]|uniref:DNA-binding SARP family transcriptional activator/tetratricopeptide (TPR) repeat protein n=1 Tax=Saccharothrix violaceirubra TaxID=413306 RepID=A0A7W7T645_9PSEU|nr:BTAD domain-containing putative transcriptional regulator [Saccharothrix violaceirubra]MBB4967240.1 DNA-binding SARP family transcriptional activator/tetratricopeptide (TPR) repeat protein [Saccharothrix violaceirubra]